MSQASKQPLGLDNDDDFRRATDTRPALSETSPTLLPQVVVINTNPASEFDGLLLDHVSRGNSTRQSAQTQELREFTLEPQGFCQKIDSIFVNTYVELLSAMIAALAMFYPTYISLVIAIVTQILFILLPLNSNRRLRLRVYSIVVYVMLALLLVVYGMKVYFVYDDATDDESYGVYFVEKVNQKTLEKTIELDIYHSFLFETFALLVYCLIGIITYKINFEIQRSALLGSHPETYCGNKYFSEKRVFFKYAFIAFTLVEVLSMPDLLALPVLYTFLFLMIFAITRRVSDLNYAQQIQQNKTAQQHIQERFNGVFEQIQIIRPDAGIVTWAMDKERLFKISLYWQKFVMIVQIVEFIVTQIKGVRRSQESDEVTQLSLFLYILRCLGHAEYQIGFGDNQNYLTIGQQMTITVLIVFLAQIYEKAYILHNQISQYDEQERFGDLEQHSNTALFQPDQLIDATRQVYSWISCGRRITAEDWKAGFYGYLPVMLNWSVRISVGIFAYMYNSYVGFYHLVWVLTSFICPQVLFYNLSVFFGFPIVCAEFALIYVANIREFNNAAVYSNQFVQHYQFKPANQFLELSLIYMILILVGLMIPARFRFKAYSDANDEHDMVTDKIIQKIKDENSSVLWKILFIVIVYLRTPVLFLMLFIGNQNFNLFQTGFLFFFVAYGASNWFYQKTSILLPIFICYFIGSQYYWSLVYADYEKTYNTATDFLFVVDGWVPPEDSQNSYWARLPPIRLWALLFIMHLLYSICQEFHNQEENAKYVEDCDKQISKTIPWIAKNLKLAWDTLFMLILSYVMFTVAKDLIQQQSNLINLVYLILFVITFGKMCSTSLDGSSHKSCIFFANMIKLYSAGVLFILVFYHMARFELTNNLIEWDRLIEEKNFFVLSLKLIGFSEDESGTKSSVQIYTGYLIIGQILEYHFDKNRKKYEGRDLFDWDRHFKDNKGVKRAYEYFQYDIAYIVYRYLNYWKYMDFICMYFHLLTNGLIVYFSVHVSISLFLALNISIIVFFYVYNSYIIHEKTKKTEEQGQVTYDIQQATDVNRAYKKLASTVFLRTRQNLWMTQYTITLFFMFMGYMDEFIDEIIKNNPTGTLKENVELVQFYLYWTGCYFTSTLVGDSEILDEGVTETVAPGTKSGMTGLHPVHIMFCVLLIEKQAQNWLFSRWGLNKTMISKFATLEFFRSNEKKGKNWLSKTSEIQSQLPQSCRDLMLEPINQEIIIPKYEQNALWMMEDFNNQLVKEWREIKLRSREERNQMTFENSRQGLETENRIQEQHIDTMVRNEIVQLDEAMTRLFGMQFKLANYFDKHQQKIDRVNCVLYQSIKHVILEKLYREDRLNKKEIPFLSYSTVKEERGGIHYKLKGDFYKAAEVYCAQKGVDISDRVKQELNDLEISKLQEAVMQAINRRYYIEMMAGTRLIFEQISLVLNMLNVVIKCNIASLVYLILVTNYLLREKKQVAMRNMVYWSGLLFFLQYWVYLFNLTSESSPTPFPQDPYPDINDIENPYGKYLIPVMYKFEFGRNMKNAYWYSFGVELWTVQTLWIDFISLAFVASYLYHYRNPVLSTQCGGFIWAFTEQRPQQAQNSEEVQQIINSTLRINFYSLLDRYHKLMSEKYPAESELYKRENRLRELKDSCPYYLVVRNAQVLIFTTAHIFTMIVIMLMAYCRRSFVSFIYVFVLWPCLNQSSKVLQQHDDYLKGQAEVKRLNDDPNFRNQDEKTRIRQENIIMSKYQWSFIPLICKWIMSIAYLDFVSQVAFQMPFIPEDENLKHIGLRKIYPPQEESFDYQAFISGDYKSPQLNTENLLMQFLSCVILAITSTQAELFKSQGYKNFFQKKDQGLDLLMKLAQLKKQAITFAFNNTKMLKILQMQKTEWQILECVRRIRLNAELFRKSQQRIMLEEYVRNYGGLYIAPEDIPTQEQVDRHNRNKDPSNRERSRSIQLEDQERIERLVADQTLFIRQKVLPYRATIYLWLMGFSQSYIFIHRARDMLSIHEDMKLGKDNAGIDLIRQIRSDLYAAIRLWEEREQRHMKQEDMTQMQINLNLTDLRQTYVFCKWANVMSRILAAISRAIISNTATIAYTCMLISMYINAGIVAIIYPFAVFGYALLEETRPGKKFWRRILTYSLVVLFLKYVVNIKMINEVMSATSLPFANGFIKFGLHHLEQTKDLVWHMLPEMMIVTSILCHEIVEQFTGLYDTTEYDVETVPEAIDRIFETSKYLDEERAKPKMKVVDPIDASESGLQWATNNSQLSSELSLRYQNLLINQGNTTPQNVLLTDEPARNTAPSLKALLIQEEDPKKLAETFQNQIITDEAAIPSLEFIKVEDQPKIHNQVNSPPQNRETISTKLRDSVMQQLKRKLDEIAERDRVRSEKSLNQNQSQISEMHFPNYLNEVDDDFQRAPDTQKNQNELLHEQTSVVVEPLIEKKSIWSGSYMNRIFPRVQQQKPGSDLYGFLTFVQCILCYYLLSYFNEFSATGPYQESNIFQTEMVVILFYQIFMLLMERYIARTENRKQVERDKKTVEAVKPTIQEDELFLPAKHDETTVRLVIQKLKFTFLSDKANMESLSKIRQQQDAEIKVQTADLTPQQKWKFIVHWINLIIVHGYIFWYMPIQANIILYGNPDCRFDQIYGCKDFKMNESLQTFYLLYLVFFYLSARQISQGLPSFRRGSSTMLYEGRDSFLEEEDIANALHQAFINFPLAAEIRCLLDFTFTTTAIDLWQTCQLFQYNSDFFIAKTSSMAYNRKPWGTEPSKFSKILFGYICTTLMLSFILGPFLMFSSLGGMTLYNPVVDNDLQFWVQVNLTTTRIGEDQSIAIDNQVLPFKIYDNESPSIYDFDEQMFKKRHFDEWPETKFFDPVQLQLIVPTYYSDTTWIASDATRAMLQKYACIASINSNSNFTLPSGCDRQKNVTNIHNVTFGFFLRTAFQREGPDNAKDALGIQQRNLNLSLPEDQALINKFSQIMTEECNYQEAETPPSYTLNITEFFMPKILLGETKNVEPIYFSTRESQQDAKRNILLTYKCRDQWAISTGSENDGTPLEFTLFSQRIQTGFLQGQSILGFYTGIVLLIGMYMRPIFIFNTNRAFIYECNYPDPMLRLCESIHLNRARGNLEEEDANFRLLQDILRSPELLHALTGSNMKGGVAPSDDEKKSHMVPKAYV